nr:helix-turn-helix domain-containing protein [Enterococcus faecium]
MLVSTKSCLRFDTNTTNLSVKEIAERLQYRNPQNFIRFFKKKESITPGEYRKKYL